MESSLSNHPFFRGKLAVSFRGGYINSTTLMSWFLVFSHLIQHMESLQAGFQVLILEKGTPPKKNGRVIFHNCNKWKKSDMFEVGKSLWKSCLYNLHIPNTLTETNKIRPWQMDGLEDECFLFLCPANWQVGNALFSGSVTNLTLTCSSNWRFYPGTLEWYPNPCFGGLTPIYPHFDTILRDF